MSWLVRRAGELATQFSIGKDCNIAQERLQGQASNKPMARFGEHVLYLPLDAPNTEENKIESKLRDGVWLGVIDRTDETIIGTLEGVVKCRTIKRRPDGQQWNQEALEDMKGSAKQPVLGIHSDRIPTGITDGQGKPVAARKSGILLM